MATPLSDSKEIYPTSPVQDISGGDWVLNKNGEQATIGYFFEHPDRPGKICGLTVGHLVSDKPVVGEPLYYYTGEVKKQRRFKAVTSLGKVISHDQFTDSLIFEVDPTVKVPIRTCHIRKIGEIQACPASSWKKREVLEGHGAMSHKRELEIHDTTVSRIVLKWPSTQQHHGLLDYPVSQGGDCGAVFVNRRKRPVYMHYAGSCYNKKDPRLAKCYGAPVQEIMKRHKIEFRRRSRRLDQSQTEQQQLESLCMPLNDSKMDIDYELPIDHYIIFEKSVDQNELDWSLPIDESIIFI